MHEFLWVSDVLLNITNQQELLPDWDELPNRFENSECPSVKSTRIGNADDEFVQVRKARGGPGGGCRGVMWRIADLETALGK